METLKLTKDKYNRVLAIVRIGEDPHMDIDNTNYYMAILVVDTRKSGVMERLRDVAHKLSEHKTFTIAIFITGSYDWTLADSLVFGIDVWFITSSKEEAYGMASDIQDIVESNNAISLDLADIKTILYKGEGRNAYYGIGISKSNNLKTALDNAVHNTQECGMNIYECNKFLIAISCDSWLTKNQMSDLNHFIDSLSDKHKNYFEIKWGLTTKTDLTDNAVKVNLIASH